MSRQVPVASVPVFRCYIMSPNILLHFTHNRHQSEQDFTRLNPKDMSYTYETATTSGLAVAMLLFGISELQMTSVDVLLSMASLKTWV